MKSVLKAVLCSSFLVFVTQSLPLYAFKQESYDLQKITKAPNAVFSTNHYISKDKRKGENAVDPQDTILNLGIKSKIYDVSYVLYSKWFADRYGYPYEYVSEELDPGMHVIEFRIKTEGGDHKCRFNVVLDDNLGLDVPPDRLVRRTDIFFPKKREDSKVNDNQKGFREYVEHSEDRRFRKEVKNKLLDFKYGGKLNYYNQNLAIARLDYTFETGGMYTPWLLEYDPYRYKNKDYFSIDLGSCAPKPHIYDKPSLWIKKIGKKDYTKNIMLEPEDFKKFRIPKRLVDLILPVLKEVEIGGQNKKGYTNTYYKLREQNKLKPLKGGNKQ